MIRKNLIKCNLIREKRTGEIIVRDHLSHLVPGTEACPYCGCRGDLRIHAYYGRSLVEFVDGHVRKVNLLICRLACDRCRPLSTHAVLPDPIIPYYRHSLFFILRVLAEHALHLRSVEKICECFEISVRTFYRWQKLFKEHCAEWQGLLTAAESSLRESILALVRKDPFCSFAAAFFRQTGLSFLQSHANPARSRRLPFHPPMIGP